MGTIQRRQRAVTEYNPQDREHGGPLRFGQFAKVGEKAISL